MSEIFSTIRLLILCGGGLMFALMLFLSLPNSHLKQVVMPFVLWAVMALSIAYVISPIDIVPDVFLGVGWIDDLVAMGVAIGSGVSAWQAGKAQKQLRCLRERGWARPGIAKV